MAPRRAAPANRRLQGTPTAPNFAPRTSRRNEWCEPRLARRSRGDERSGWGGCDDGDDDNDEDEGASSCEIRVVSSLTSEELIVPFLGASAPVLITGEALPQYLANGWKRTSFARRFADVELPTEVFPYAGPFSAHLGKLRRRENVTTIAELAEAIRADECARRRRRRRRSGGGGGEDATDEPQMVFLSLHGYQPLPKGAAAANVRADISLSFAPEDEPPSSPRRLLVDYARPSAVADPEQLLRTNQIQFYMGPTGGGAQPHWHSLAWNWLVHGRKEWWLWPPHDASYAARHVSTSVGGAEAVGGRALRCTQRAGDVLVVPETWGHATVNVQPSVGWATEVHFDRNIDLGLDAKHGDEWWRTGDAPKDAPRALPRRPAAARKAAAAPPERAPPREAQEAVTVEPTGRVARKFAPGEISVGLHDGREWDFGLQPSAKRYKEKFG